MPEHVRDALDFVAFLLHRVALSWGWSVPATYRVLSSAGILADYERPRFGTLHSMGERRLSPSSLILRVRGACWYSRTCRPVHRASFARKLGLGRGREDDWEDG